MPGAGFADTTGTNLADPILGADLLMRWHWVFTVS